MDTGRRNREPGRDSTVSWMAVGSRPSSTDPPSAARGRRRARAVVAHGFIDFTRHRTSRFLMNPAPSRRSARASPPEVTELRLLWRRPCPPRGALGEYRARARRRCPSAKTRSPDYVAAPPTSSTCLPVGHNTLRLHDGRRRRAASRRRAAEMSAARGRAGRPATGACPGLFTAPGCHAEPAEIHASPACCGAAARATARRRNGAAEVSRPCARPRVAEPPEFTCDAHPAVGRDNWAGRALRQDRGGAAPRCRRLRR